MNNYRKLLIILALLLPHLTNAQSAISKSDTVLNQVDENGLKQGYWINYYENGNKRFEGNFKDDNPIGTFVRYYPDKVIQSIMEFEADRKTVLAKIFFDNGKLAGEGKYVDRLKEEEWKYYSFYDSTLSYSEYYQTGKKHGTSTVYFSNGQVSELLNFKDNVTHGDWIQYFKGGKLYVKSAFIEGKLHGDYIQCHPTGIIHIRGKYVEDRRHGEWIIYDEEGKQIEKFDFVMGIASNQDELNKRQQQFLLQLDRNKGKIREPRISDIKF